MSDEKKEVNVRETESSWGDFDWIYILMLMICFGGWGLSHDTKDHELRERVARLEGQMDMVRRDK